MREAAEGQRIGTADGAVGTTADVGVASLTRAGSPGRAFVDAGLAMHTGQRRGRSGVGRFPRGERDGDGDIRMGRS
jgi:hypothetical protein